MRSKPAKKTAGIGAKCTIQAKYLRPSKIVDEKLSNKTKHTVVENLILLKEERSILRGKEAHVYYFRHEKFENISIFANKRWVKITEEGSPDQFFSANEVLQDKGKNLPTHSEGGDDVIPDEVFRMGNRKEDIDMARNLGVEVDDDNAPAIENIPDASELANQKKKDLYPDQKWGWDGIDNRSRASVHNSNPYLAGYSSSASESLNYFQFFRIFFFSNSFVDMMIAKTNDRIEPPLNRAEFYRYLGLWLIIVSHTPGGGAFDRRAWWSKKLPSLFDGAPFRLSKFMSGNRFNDITVNLCYTDREAPSYVDKFWEIRQMVDDWNENMRNCFVPGWITCLDESMSSWLNRWTCPGKYFNHCINS